MTKLHELYETGGQSPWIDNLKRSYLSTGQLAKLVDEGIRGVTSNPTIFAKAIEGETTYDEQFAELTARHLSVRDAYWDLVIDDVTNALGVLRPLYDASGGGDGFVSLEVDPGLAHETARTIEAARSLHERIALPNLLVKIPATVEGVPAIRQMIAEGRSINVTLIFSLERYRDVMEAYLSGLEELHAAGKDLSAVASVASFFVSRVDTEADRRLEAIAAAAGDAARAERALALRGKLAIAQAHLAYELFEQRFSGPRWEPLAAAGAHVQRPLWASTSTKNPAYPDLAYVDSLIGAHTVNTMPDATVAAFLDHGTIARTVDADFAADHEVIAECLYLGLDPEDVSAVLEDEGVASFAKSFDELVDILEQKAAALGVSQ
jgi:transaldolase